MSEREKETPPANQAGGMDPELLAFLNGPPPDEDAIAMEEGIRYFASLSLRERLARNDAAQPVIERLNALARAHGLRSIGWSMCGPPDADAPEVPDVRRKWSVY